MVYFPKLYYVPDYISSLVNLTTRANEIGLKLNSKCKTGMITNILVKLDWINSLESIKGSGTQASIWIFSFYLITLNTIIPNE